MTRSVVHRVKRRVILATAAVVTLTALAACSGPARPGSSAADRDTKRAQVLTERSASLRDSDPEAAFRVLRDAIAADPFYAPAHNNLGVLQLKTGQLNSARASFETARKLMPNDAGPHLNLALVYTAAGLTDEAESLYVQVLETHPGNTYALRGLLVLRTDRGLVDDETRGMLEQLAMSDDPLWGDWARERLRVQGAGLRLP